MNTIVVDNYTFDKVAQTITLPGFTSLKLSDIVSITDVTNGIQMFYNKLPSYGATIVGNVITLQYDTNNNNFNNDDSILVELALDNYSQVVMASGARVAAGNSNPIFNYGNKGAVFCINTTAVSGETPIMTVKLQMENFESADWVDVPGAVTSNIVATGKTLLTVYPGISEVANAKVSFPLPRKYRALWSISGAAPSFTFSISAHYSK